MDTTQYLVELENISKSFRGVHALRNVSLNVKPGEIHALVGENGAGKSTLMKILSGAYRRDSGTIRINGKEVENNSPHAGRENGIGIIYQEFALTPDLTVAENIFMNRLNDHPLIRWSSMYKEAQQLIQDVGFDINPRRLVRDLSVAYQQVVEITRELSSNVKLLILDEPTAVLAPREVDHLFEVLNRLKAQGISFIYITHRLHEVFQIADRITVLKDGELVDTVNCADVDESVIINMMIGRELSAMYPKREARIGEEVLRITNISSDDGIKDISFSVRAGEVLGVAGLIGSGRTEMARAIFGATRSQTGTIELNGQVCRISNPKQAVQSGFALVPEDRKQQGVILGMSVRKNITLPSIRKFVSRLGVFQAGKEKQVVQDLVTRLNVKTNTIDTEVADLSGGNQQKVALAKWLSADSKVLFLDEPTRGVDVGAKVEIYNLINDLAANGLAIVMISSEMMEVIGMADRVMVMSDGRITGFLEGDEITEENIMRLSIIKRRPAQREEAVTTS